MNNYYPDVTIPGIFRNRAFYYRNDVFLKRRGPDFWMDICWEEAYIKANAISSYLINYGVKPGDRVGIYSENMPEWILADLGILSAGSADVIIDPSSPASEAASIIIDSDIRICFCSGRRQVENLLSVKNGLPALEQIIVFSHVDYNHGPVITLDRVIQEGLANDRSEDIESRIRSIDPGEIMTVIYTASPSGSPRRITLSADDILSELRNVTRHQPNLIRDVVLSMLPLSHPLERILGYYRVMYAGGTIAYSLGTDSLVADLADVRPTAMICTPRVAEKLYEAIQEIAAKSPALRLFMFRWAKKTAMEAAPFFDAGRHLPGMLKRKYALAGSHVFLPVRAAAGIDRLGALFIGEAPVPEEVRNFFIGLGLYMVPVGSLADTVQGPPVIHKKAAGDYTSFSAGAGSRFRAR
jgi:long-chain acyl-CoA synthetase